MEAKNIYNHAKIYKIVCNTTALVYIGSTTQRYLSQRIAEHKSSFKRWTTNKSKQFCSSFEILKGGNYSYILLEECNCQNKDQLHARERFHIENTECVNIYTPNQTPDELVEWQRQYYIANNARILEYHKQFYQNHREQKKQYAIDHMEHIKEYQRNYQKIYREAKRHNSI